MPYCKAMSFNRSLALLCSVTLIAGCGLCLLELSLAPAAAGRGAYAALITSAELPDAEIRELITGNNSNLQKVADSLISESSQWVLLDDFTDLIQIPLIEYGERILPFDPRNDGYASRLYSFFVRGGQRILFIPLDKISPEKLEKSLAIVLKHIPFSLEFLGLSRPVRVFFLLLGAASAVLLLFRFLPFSRRMETTELLFCLPVLAPLVFYGAPGFILSALLLGTASLLREPFAELSVIFRRKGRLELLSGRAFFSRFRRDVYSPFKINWRLSATVLSAYLLISIFTRVSVLFSAVMFLLFAAAYGYSVKTWLQYGERQNHIRFLPVLMLKPSLNLLFSAVVMLPFILAAAASGILNTALPVAAASPDLFSLQGDLITEDEYLAHAAFQSSFSYRPLGGNQGPEEIYPVFTLGSDNLIEPLRQESVRPQTPQAPPFPLKNLMEFLSIQRGDKNIKKQYHIQDS